MSSSILSFRMLGRDLSRPKLIDVLVQYTFPLSYSYSLCPLHTPSISILLLLFLLLLLLLFLLLHVHFRISFFWHWLTHYFNFFNTQTLVCVNNCRSSCFNWIQGLYITKISLNIYKFHNLVTGRIHRKKDREFECINIQKEPTWEKRGKRVMWDEFWTEARGHDFGLKLCLGKLLFTFYLTPSLSCLSLREGVVKRESE